MTLEHGSWPSYTSPLEALEVETTTWGRPRLDQAEDRYAQLDGELPATVTSLGITIVDGDERPDEFSLLRLYDRQRFDPSSFGSLLMVNYQGTKPPLQTRELIAAIKRQRARVSVPTALAVVGYEEPRRIDHLKSNAWDIAVVHALRRSIEHPIVGVANDADITGLAPNYLPVMSRNQSVGQPAMAWGTPIRYERHGHPDSAMNRYLEYVNVGRALAHELLQAPLPYGSSIATTLDNYAIAGDWTRPQDGPNPYGVGGTVKLLVNMWEELMGEEAPVANTIAVRMHCFRWLDSYVVVSPRREIYGFLHGVGDPRVVSPALTTEPDNPIRQLGRGKLADMADSVSADDPHYNQRLNEFDQVWLADIPEVFIPLAQARLRQARLRLGLAPPAFD